jgi:DNA-directed RNA polymerase subunit RPC12/RpoP
MVTEIECSKCGGKMLKGFIFDRGHYEHKEQQVWVEGEPERSFWSGVKTKDRNTYSVDAYRCSDCGRLDFYTTEQADI